MLMGDTTVPDAEFHKLKEKNDKLFALNQQYLDEKIAAQKERDEARAVAEKIAADTDQLRSDETYVQTITEKKQALKGHHDTVKDRAEELFAALQELAEDL
jgi:hypothetical protein